MARCPTPTRSLPLGDPAGVALVYGCVIDLDDDGEIAGGILAPARLLFWQPEHPSTPGTGPDLVSPRDRPRY